MGSTDTKFTAPQPPWLRDYEVAACEDISRREVYRRGQQDESGRYLDEAPLIWKNREDGKPGRLYDPASLSATGRERLKLSRLSAAMDAYTRPATSLTDKSTQLSLIPDVDANRRRLAAMGVPGEKADEVLREFGAMQPLFNGDHILLHYKSHGALRKDIAKKLGVSARTLQRRERAFKRRQFLGDLVKRDPGPRVGERLTLDLSIRSFIREMWLQGQTRAQIVRAVQGYIQTKANSPEWRASHSCKRPSRSTIEREINRLDALTDAAREGPDSVHAASGHISRAYLDLESLERVESDEVKLNALSFDPRRPVNRRGEPWIRRYWLLTFYDARAMYPLVWHLCEGSEYELRHGIAVEDEINLFVALIRGFGVPAAIHSDRGRFRGRDWGGEPYQQRIDKEFAPANGILQRVGQLAGLPEGIRHDMPRVHNPRGTRLERFHRWVADWFRSKPGWIGANTKERKMTHGDAEAECHKLWCVGSLAPGERSPLMTRDEIFSEVNKTMEAWRQHNSEGTDMCGMTPHAVFTQCAPVSGFRQISEDQLAFATAKHFENQLIRQGGIIELPGGLKYFHASLAPLAGQKREVARLRHDHSFITVLPAQKGQPEIIAPRRIRVGMKDEQELSRQMELHKRIEKIVGESVKPLEYDPGSQFVEAPKASQVIHPSEFMAAQEAPEPDAPDFPETGSVEWQSEGKGPRPEPWDFADLET
jgi:hypothetical protein